MSKQNTNAHGSSWTDEQIVSVWRKGLPIPGSNPNFVRKDICGNTIQYSQHGNRNHVMGWEIDHIYPKAKGGSDNLDNLQPLQWENNLRKGDTYPWGCR